MSGKTEWLASGPLVSSMDPVPGEFSGTETYLEYRCQDGTDHLRIRLNGSWHLPFERGGSGSTQVRWDDEAPTAAVLGLPRDRPGITLLIRDGDLAGKLTRSSRLRVVLPLFGVGPTYWEYDLRDGGASVQEAWAACAAESKANIVTDLQNVAPEEYRAWVSAVSAAISEWNPEAIATRQAAHEVYQRAKADAETEYQSTVAVPEAKHRDAVAEADAKHAAAIAQAEARNAATIDATRARIVEKHRPRLEEVHERFEPRFRSWRTQEAAVSRLGRDARKVFLDEHEAMKEELADLLNKRRTSTAEDQRALRLDRILTQLEFNPYSDDGGTIQCPGTGQTRFCDEIRDRAYAQYEAASARLATNKAHLDASFQATLRPAERARDLELETEIAALTAVLVGEKQELHENLRAQKENLDVELAAERDTLLTEMGGLVRAAEARYAVVADPLRAWDAAEAAENQAREQLAAAAGPAWAAYVEAGMPGIPDSWRTVLSRAP